MANDADVSFLFGGVGDARNVFTTFIWIGESETKKPTRRSFHITINDIKPPAIARDLIVMFLLDEVLSPQDETEAVSAVFNTLGFVFSAPIMPKQAYIHLRRTISKAITAIEKSLLPSWIVLRDSTGPEILPILKGWLDDAPKLFPTDFVIDETLRGVKSPLAMDESDKDLTEACKIEKQCFQKTATLFPPDDNLKADDQKLFELINRYRQRKENKILSRIKKHVAEHWQPNLTMLDIPWLLSGDHLYNISPDPWQTDAKLMSLSGITPPKKPRRTLEYVELFFQMAVAGLSCVRDRVKIEVTVGDVAKALEDSRSAGQLFEESIYQTSRKCNAYSYMQC